MNTGGQGPHLVGDQLAELVVDQIAVRVERAA
jgi:hypothetical protein